MNKNKIISKLLNKNDVLNYFKFFPYYLSSSFFAFITDAILYSFLRPIHGIIFSSIVAFLGGTTILFVILKFTNKSRIRSKSKGYLLQVLIGIGSLFINIFTLFLIDILAKIYFRESFQVNSMYSLSSKIISGSFGFIWSSFFTSKFNFSHLKR